jgi:2-polyprenyl-3-methyl-5-hydroxy-6-metoxy-1,4-benzoquinol methylase
MPGCCATDYRRFFNRKFAQRDLERYRRSGLSATERDLVGLCGDVSGATILEAGGGIGALQLELLDAGAAAATNVELSAGYEEAAAELFAGRGVERRVGDFVDEDVEPHDIVLLHRVVCCYPDVGELLAAAAQHARRALVFSHPPRNPVSRAVVGTQNLLLRLGKRKFRTFAHPPSAMRAVLAEHGLRPTVARRGPVWWIATAVR